MGIIIKQSIKGSFWSYLGVVIGFITTSYLYPNYLTTETVGLFGLISAYTVLLSEFSALGFHAVTARLFPYFRNEKKGHNGFVFILIIVILIGFLLVTSAFYILKPWIIESNIEKSKIFADYIYLLLPLTLFTLLYNQFDIYNKLLYDAVFGTFLQEFLQRIMILIVTLLYAFHIINLNQFIIAFACVLCLKGLVLLLYLLIKGDISIMPQLSFLNNNLISEMISVALYGILAGIGGSIVFSIDKIIINQMLGLASTGVYTIAFFFGTLVIIPSRTLIRISGTLIAEAFKKNDLKYISEIYHKSCLTQLIIGAFIFGGIWLNIENIISILGPEYNEAQWVIFFIGLGYLVDMTTGANGQIIAYSKHYKVALLFILILIVLVIILMYILVPKWGITGGAIAIAFSIIMNNIMRALFLKVKYDMQPFVWKFLVIIGVAIFAYTISSILPIQKKILPDILFRSSVFTVIYTILIFRLKVSNDINQALLKIINR